MDSKNQSVGVRTEQCSQSAEGAEESCQEKIKQLSSVELRHWKKKMYRGGTTGPLWVLEWRFGCCDQSLSETCQRMSQLREEQEY